MSDERWRVISLIYSDAAALAPVDPAVFLRNACRGDEAAIRRGDQRRTPRRWETPSESFLFWYFPGAPAPRRSKQLALVPWIRDF